MIKLSFPFTEEKIRALKVGEEVLISGIVFTFVDTNVLLYAVSVIDQTLV
jgi:tartrate dehydratase beta subunit/fumarate hydratase class I family protein